jgi:hypothetical protein
MLGFFVAKGLAQSIATTFNILPSLAIYLAWALGYQSIAHMIQSFILE